MIEELITEKNDMTDKESYYNAIVSTIIRIGRAEKFIIAMSELIQRLTVDHLILSETSMTEVLDHILLWMSLWRTIRLIFNGEIMMFCGWELQQGREVHCQCDPYLCKIWQPGYPGRRIWD